MARFGLALRMTRCSVRAGTDRRACGWANPIVRRTPIVGTGIGPASATPRVLRRAPAGDRKRGQALVRDRRRARDSLVAFAIAPRSCELAIPFAKSTCPVAAFVAAAARRSRQCRQFAGRRFRASPITSCVGTDGTDGRPRPRSPGCRLARGSGRLIAAGTRAAPTRPFGKRDGASYRSSVGGRRLCRAHNSAITGSHDYAVDPATATVAKQSQRAGPAYECPVAKAVAGSGCV